MFGAGLPVVLEDRVAFNRPLRTVEATLIRISRSTIRIITVIFGIAFLHGLFVIPGGPVKPAMAQAAVTLHVAADSACTSGCPLDCTCPRDCGDVVLPYRTIQDALNDANCRIAAAEAPEAIVRVAAGYYPERIFIFPDIHVIGAADELA